MTPLALERFGAQQAIGRSLSGKASLSFPRAQDLKGALYGKPAVWEAAANTTEWVLDTRPVATTNTRLVKTANASPAGQWGHSWSAIAGEDAISEWPLNLRSSRWCDREARTSRFHRPICALAIDHRI
jgi:hypothetical protein